MSEVLTDVFGRPDTSVADLALAGWEINRGVSPWVFRNRDTGAVQQVPQWIVELVDRAQRSGEMGVQAKIRFALGINSQGCPPGHVS